MAWAAVGVGAASTLLGGVQSLIAGNAQGAAQRELENKIRNAPKYKGSPTLERYYQDAQRLANTAAQQSALYKQQMNQTNRLMGAGIAGLGSRPGGQGAVASLVQKGADLSGNALAQAYGQKEQRFGRLGQVAQAKAADEMKQFQINQQMPWEAGVSLSTAKAQGATRDLMQAQRNMSQGINYLGMGAAGLINKYAGKGGGKNRKSGGGFMSALGLNPDVDEYGAEEQ